MIVLAPFGGATLARPTGRVIHEGIRMPLIAAGAHRIHFRFDGPEDRPVILLAHSLAASMAMWAPQMPYLTSRFRVLSVDMRGHGGSTPTKGEYSMGGMIGMTLAAKHPGLLRSVVLCDTMCEVPEAFRSALDGRMALARKDGIEPLVEPTIERWFTPPFVARNPPILDQVRADIRNTPVAGYVGCCGAIQTLDLRNHVAGIAIPTLVIVGRDDPATPVAASAVIHRAIAGSTLAVLDEASHLSNIEQPEAFDAALAAFHDRHAAGELS